MAVSENGYYYIINNIMHFYDIATDVDVALCSKLECLHDSSQCDAYVKKEKKNITITDGNGNVISDSSTELDKSKEVNCVGHMIFYYNEHIYMVERNDIGDYLVRYDARFNNKERLSLIADNGSRIGSPESANMKDTAFLMDGYLYYMSVTESASVAETNFMTQLACNRVKLEPNAVPEKLGEFDIAVDVPDFGSSSRAMVYGINDKMYYITSLNSRFMVKENCSQYRVAVYDATNGNFNVKLHINSNEIADVLGSGTGKVNLYQCCVDKAGNVYAVSKSDSECAVWKFDLNEGCEPRKVYSTSGSAYISNLIYDGEYIHFYEECTNYDTYKKVISINTLGEVIGTIALEADFGDTGDIKVSAGSTYVFGADGRYLVIGNKSGVYVYDMRNIGTTGSGFRKL